MEWLLISEKLKLYLIDSRPHMKKSRYSQHSYLEDGELLHKYQGSNQPTNQPTNQSINQSFRDFLLATYNAQYELTKSGKRY